MARTIVFLSDYGLDDEFVGVCHGVIGRIAPGAPVVDLTHGVPSQDILRGAMLLAQNAEFFEPDAVFLAVVDPGVGSARRGIAVQTKDGATLVGPDNGLLSLAWETLGGLDRAVELTESAYRLPRVSETFHGRDVFAPAAAHVSAGVGIDALGPAYDTDDLVRLEVPAPEVHPGSIRARVLSVDRYGNIELSAKGQELAAAGFADAEMLEGNAAETRFHVRRARTFADLRQGELGVLVDSLGWISIVLNGGSAAEALGVAAAEQVELTATG